MHRNHHKHPGAGNPFFARAAAAGRPFPMEGADIEDGARSGGPGGPRGQRGPRGAGRGFPGGFGAFGAGFGQGFADPDAQRRARGGRGPGGRGPGGRRGRRGNTRAAVLALLAEEAQHGYAIMTELGERSGGLWRPSPGSVYPVLAQLQDEGLVVAEDSEGRKIFSLTEAGRTYVTEHADELKEPWQVGEEGPRQQAHDLMRAMGALAGAMHEVARQGQPEQVDRAVKLLDDTRKKLYSILAEDAGSTESES